jgi:hypothetical protein
MNAQKSGRTKEKTKCLETAGATRTSPEQERAGRLPPRAIRVLTAPIRGVWTEAAVALAAAQMALDPAQGVGIKRMAVNTKAAALANASAAMTLVIRMAPDLAKGAETVGAGLETDTTT